MEADEDLDPGPALRRSRTFAVLGFILVATSILLPWWTVTLDKEGNQVDRVDLRLWSSHVIAKEALIRMSFALVGLALLPLFVRIAAGSWKHEPKSWFRDISIATGLVTGAVVLAFFWPTGQPRFWDVTRVTLDGVDFVEKAMPGLGWWCAAVGGTMLGSSLLAASREAIPVKAERNEAD